MAPFDDQLPEDLRDIAERLTEARATFSPLELDALNGRLRRRFERSPRSRRFAAGLRMKSVAGLGALGLMLTSGAGVVIASSEIGGGHDTFNGTRLHNTRDSSECEYKGRHEKDEEFTDQHGKEIDVRIVFDCREFKFHIEDSGHFNWVENGKEHSSWNSTDGTAPTGTTGLTIKTGHSSITVPFD